VLPPLTGISFLEKWIKDKP
jgi:hypothetical protein